MAFEDHAHAAAADFTIEPEVGSRQLGQFVLDGAGASACGVAGLFQVVEKGKDLQQFGRVGRMFGRKRGEVRCVSEVASVKVEVDQLLEGGSRLVHA
ncbi:MAG: hypothetical protein MJ249_14715 [Kiritimatiellae bacterium]|nr:hypothetical protein [Kiritimatiellia bacterium]